MTHPQDGSVSNKRMVYPEISIFVSSKTKEDAVSSVKEILTQFVPEGTSLSIMITSQAVYEEPFATPATTVFWGT